MKKIIILTIALFFGIAGMAYLYFSKLSNENNAKDLALQSATNNAAIVFSFQNDKGFYEIIKAQNLIQQVLGEDKIQLLIQLKDLIINDNALNKFIQDQYIYVSVLPDSNKTLNFLITVQLRADEDLNKFNQVIKSKNYITPLQNGQYSLRLNDSVSAYANLNDRVITLSTSLKFINDAAIRLAENPFTDYIKENNAVSRSALAQIYINFNHVPLVLKNILTGKLNGSIEVLNKQNAFASLSYNFSKERILFNGSTTLKDDFSYLKLFEQSAAQVTNIQNILPDNTANYAIYAFDDYKTWFKSLKTLQTKANQITQGDQTISSIKNDYRTDLNLIFPLYAKNQFATFQLSTSEKLGAIQLTNGEKVKQLLFDVSTDYSDEIKVFKSANILQVYFGEAFKNFSKPFYAIIDNYLIVANNASTIASFLNSYKNNRLMIQNPIYMDAMNQISTTSNISYYVDLRKSENIFRDNISSKYYKHFRADSGLKTFDTFCYQLIADKNKFISNVLLNKYVQQPIPDSLSIR